MEEADLGSCFRWLQKKFLEQKDTHTCGMNNLWLGWKWSNEGLRNSPGTFTAINGYLEQNVGMSSGLLSQCLQERLDKKGSQFFSSPGRHHFFYLVLEQVPSSLPNSPLQPWLRVLLPHYASLGSRLHHGWAYATLNSRVAAVIKSHRNTSGWAMSC